MSIDLILLIIYLFIALSFSFICSMMEAVLLSLTPQYASYLQSKSSSTGKMIQVLKADINKPLTAILTLNTVAHTMGAAGVGAQVMKLYGSHYLTLSSMVLTVLILFLSEIIPKTLGTFYWKQLTLFIFPLIYWLTKLLHPVIVFTKYITPSLITNNTMTGFAREEFHATTELAKNEGAINFGEYLILDNLLKLKGRTIHEIMTPRTVTFVLSGESLVNQFFHRHDDEPFSRIPIYKKYRENIIGFVMRGDLLLSQARGNGNKKLKSFKRDLLVINNKSSILKALELMIERKAHIAMLSDEYGVFLGIVTLEDIFEELIGAEIMDEHDKVSDMQKLAMLKKNK